MTLFRDEEFLRENQVYERNCTERYHRRLKTNCFYALPREIRKICFSRQGGLVIEASNKYMPVLKMATQAENYRVKKGASRT